MTNGQANGANVKLDEITPLLHQTCISPKNDVPIVNGHSNHRLSKAHHHHNNSSNTGGNAGSGKATHRKRFKTKSGRKVSPQNVPDNNNLSDSDRN